MQETTNTPVYVLGKASATFLNLRVDAPEVRILVTGPQMLYARLRLLTSLGMLGGCHYRSLEALAASLEAEARCGEHGVVPLAIEVVPRRTAAVIEIDVGPMSMYQSELRLRTRGGESLDEAIRTHFGLAPGGDEVVGLEPLPGAGHGHQHHRAMGDGMGEHDAHA